MDSSNFWKLDKIDKIGITLIFIIFALYSTFSCFASEIESVVVSSTTGLAFNNSDSYIHTTSATNGFGYFSTEPGYRYTIKTYGSRLRSFAFSNEQPDVGVEIYDYFELEGGSEYSFNGGAFQYVFFNIYPYVDINVEVTREKIEGMSGSVDLLAGDVGFNLWESFSNTIVYALPITITCFGIYIICGFIKKFSKGV